jgi:tripartite-type tricarboxylate transporter receptor subunit TctC
MYTRRRLVQALGSSVLVPAAGSALAAAPAANYPVRPVRMIVPLAPGGGSDAIARLVSANLTERLGQQFIVDNRPAASGIVGTDLVAKAPPDGYTLLTVFSTHAMSAELFAKLPYHPINDFAPITLATESPLVLLTTPSLPVNNFKEFVAYAKANPGKLNYGSSGPGSAPHLMTEQLNAMAGIQTTHIAYKGVAPLTTALIQGELQFALANIFTTLPHVKAGRMKLLATGGTRRSPIAPDVPTIAESGLPGYDSVVWYGFFAPAKTPRPIVETLHREIVAVLRRPEVSKIIIDGGNEPVGNTPAEFAALIRAEAKKWGALGRKLGISLD